MAEEDEEDGVKSVDVKMSKNEIEKQLIFEKFETILPEIISKAEYSELYGYDLTRLATASSGDEKDKVILECLLRKFLQANNYEIEAAKAQLLKSLKWRREFKPLSAAFLEEHYPELQKLGIVTSAPVGGADGGSQLVTTWNLYGAIKDRESLFGDIQGFLRWRVGLMEQGISLLDFSNPKESSMTQVHDYFDVSFFRLDPKTKAATKATIQLLQDHYPETLSAKYFVNVPTIMGWVFSFVKPFLSKETVAKFHVLSNGKSLANDIGDWVPKSYGGKGGESLNDIRVKEFSPRDDSLVKKREAVSDAITEPATATTEDTATGVETGTAPAPAPGPVQAASESEAQEETEESKIPESEEKTEEIASNAPPAPATTASA